MRRVLACLGIAALAFLATGPTAGAQTESDVGPAIFGQPVINEVATRGPAGAMDQYIEIVNPSRTTVADISGWLVQIYSSTNTLLQVIVVPEGTVLPPLGAADISETFWTLSSTAFTGGAVDQPGAIVVDIPDNGGVALFNPGGSKIDGVAFSPSAVTPLEGSALSPQPAFLDFLSPASGRNILSQDTNNNLLDFKLMVRSPDAPN
jgi:hypothetical protein